MFFPESLYLLSERDQQVSWLEPLLLDTLLVNVGPTIFVPIFTVPIGKILLLTNLAVFSSVAGDSFNGTFADIIAPPFALSTYRVRLAQERSAAAQTTASLNWQGSIVIPPEWTLRVVVTKAGAVELATVDCGTIGMLLPAANVQRV